MSDHMGHPGNDICCKCLDEDESDLQLKSFWHLPLSGLRVFEGRSANKSLLKVPVSFSRRKNGVLHGFYIMYNLT